MRKVRATAATPVPRVFVSATSGDLGAVRRAVANGLRGIGALAVEQEYFAPPGQTIAGMLEEKIRDCQAVIHIVGARFGAEDGASPHAHAGHTYAEGRRSYTQLEHDLALALRKRLYVFICGDDFPYDPCDEEAPELKQCQADHRRRLLHSSHFRAKVSSPNDLLGQVGRLEEQVRALSHELMEIGGKVDSLSGSLRRYWAFGSVAAVFIAAGIWGLAQRGKEVRQAAIETRQAVTDALAENRAIVARLASLYNESAELKESLTDAEKFERAVQRIADAEKMTKGDVLARVDSFVAGVRAREKEGRADFYDLGLAAFAEKNFVKAASFATQAAAVAREERLAAGKALVAAAAKVRSANEAERKAEKLAGDAEDAAFHYDRAAAHYRAAAALHDLEREPGAWVHAHFDLVGALLDAGKYAEALPTAQKVSDSAREKLGAGNADTLASEIMLARVLGELGDQAREESLLLDVRERCERTLGPSHRLTLAASNNLGMVYLETGKLAKAEQLLHRVADATGANLLTASNNLATALLAKGDLQEAADLLASVLAKSRELRGDNHPETTAVANQLGLVYLQQKKTDEALALLVEQRDIVLRTLGEDHPGYYKATHNLGLAWEQKGDDAQAEQFFRSALAACERMRGETHPETLTCLKTLRDFFTQRRQYDQVRPVLENTYLRLEKALGTDHLKTIECLTCLGLCFEALDDSKSSRKHILSALEADERRRASSSATPSAPPEGESALVLESLYLHGQIARAEMLGREHPDTLKALSALADICRQQEKMVAVEYYEQLLQGQEHALGKDDPGTLATASKLGKIYTQLRKLDKAGPLLERVLEAKRRTLGGNHPDCSQSMRDLSVLRAQQNEAAQAEQLLLQAVEIAERAAGPDDPKTLEVRHYLAEFLIMQKQPARARDILVPLLQNRSRILGPRHMQTQQTSESLARAYYALQMPDKAEPLILDSLATFEDLLVKEARCSPTLVSALADHYQATGSGTKAVELHERVCTATRRVFGTDHAHSLTALSALAIAEERNGKIQEAQSHLAARVLRIASAKGENSRDTYAATADLARFFVRTKAFDKAEPLYRQMLEAQESKLGKEHPDTLATVNLLGVMYEKKEEHAKAQALFERALASREHALGPKHAETCLSAYNLASNYRAQKLHSDRVAILARQAYEGWLQAFGPDNSSTKRAKKLLDASVPVP